MDLLKEVFNNFKEVYDGRTETRRRLDSFRAQSDNWMGDRARSRQEGEKIPSQEENIASS